MTQKTKNYFKEDEFRKQLRIINSPRYNEYHKKKQYEVIISILQDLNLRVLNKKFDYFVNRYNLVQNYNYLNLEKTELLQDIITQQLGQLKRFDKTRNTKLFSYLTQIQENVIKYKIQNLVRETNYFVYLDGIHDKNNESDDINGLDFIIQNEYSYTNEIDFDSSESIIKLNFDKFQEMKFTEFFERYLPEEIENIEVQKFLIVYEKYINLLNKLRESKDNPELTSKLLNQIMILNRYLLYFYYKSIRVKRRYKKKKKKTNEIFEIEQKLKYVRSFSSLFFRINTTINLNDLYELLNE